MAHRVHSTGEWLPALAETRSGLGNPATAMRAISGAGSASGIGTGSTTVFAWFHLDAQGTPRALSDGTGGTISAASYTDFGSLEPSADTRYAGSGKNPMPGQVDRALKQWQTRQEWRR
jgi:hypothetical protein